MSPLRLDLEDLEAEALGFTAAGDGLESLGMGHGTTEVGASAVCICSAP